MLSILALLLIVSYIAMFTVDKPSFQKSFLGINNGNTDSDGTNYGIVVTQQRSATAAEVIGISGGISSRSSREAIATVAYAISVTGCGDGKEPLVDGAAVLKHSIHLSSIENPQSTSKYSYKMYAIIHPEALQCTEKQLASHGYTILVRKEPVAVKDIEGEFLRERVEKNGCCGAKEFIKLHAYTITDHPIVVHLDLDTLILKPLDDVFDAMLYDETTEIGHKARKSLPVFLTNIVPKAPNAFFTRDYNMHQGKTTSKALVQGGFLVLRPSLETYKMFCNVIKEGDYRSTGGWGGKGYGAYGAMTFQGIIPYFYDQLQPGTAVELNRCFYNNMCDNPRDQKTMNDIVSGKCCDGRVDCEDCRSVDISLIKTAHFTLCQKPWHCLPSDTNRIQERLCRKLHHEWFRVRKDLEDFLIATNRQRRSVATGTFQPDHFYGFCTQWGERGYIGMGELIVQPNIT